MASGTQTLALPTSVRALPHAWHGCSFQVCFLWRYAFHDRRLRGELACGEHYCFATPISPWPQQPLCEGVVLRLAAAQVADVYSGKGFDAAYPWLVTVTYFVGALHERHSPWVCVLVCHRIAEA